MIKRTAICLAVVFIIGFFYAYASNEYENDFAVGLGGGFAALAGYLAIALILAAFHGVCGLLYLWWFGGRDFEEAYLADLRSAKMPYPRPWDSRRFDYLAMIADDPTADVEDRVKAAFMTGQHKLSLSRSGMFGAMAIERGADAAVLRYSQEAPPEQR